MDPTLPEPASPEQLGQRLEELAARAAGQSPPSPGELAALLAQCRALAQGGDDSALELGAGVSELILDLARERGPAYLAALEID